MSVWIRVATGADAQQLQRIYAWYVNHTAVSFEYVAPTVEEFRGRMEQVLARYPFLVAERQGEILGYANTKTFYPRAAYDWSAETTIYLRPDAVHMGTGARLYRVLEEISRAQNITNLNACIAWIEEPDEYLDHNSVDFHSHVGFRMVGRFHGSGCKFGRWYDMVWMERILGDHVENPQPVIPFPELPDPVVERLCRL